MGDHCSNRQHVAIEWVQKLNEEHGKQRDSDGLLDINVSFDGTWFTRGHKLHIGAAFVMDIFSGVVLDCEVLSSYCEGAQ